MDAVREPTGSGGGAPGDFTVYQIGLRRHGASPVPEAAGNFARRHGCRVDPVLVATPDNPGIASGFARPAVLVDDIEDPAAIARALHTQGFAPRAGDVFIPGTEESLRSVFRLSGAYGAAPGALNPGFEAPGKIEQRRCYEDAGVPQPRFAVVSALDPRAVRDAAARVLYPVVLKFPRLVGGRGVLLARDTKELADRLETITKLDAFDRADPEILVEQYIPHGQATEYAVQGVALGGAVLATSISGKRVTIDEPTGRPGEEYQFRETEHRARTPDPADPLHQTLVDLVGRALRAMPCANDLPKGYRTGAFQADLMMQPDGTGLMIEISPRSAGSYAVNDLVSPYGPIMEATLDVMHGRAPEPRQPPHRFAGYVQRLDPGELHRVAALPPDPDLQIEVIESQAPGDTRNRRLLVTSNTLEDGAAEDRITNMLGAVTAGRGTLAAP